MSIKKSQQLPSFFLFKDLYASHLEAKKIIKASSDDSIFSSPEKIKKISQHYLMLFEVLEFLHEYTPDFFIINKIKKTQDIHEEIVCFANEEFSKTFELKQNPEGKDILKLITKNEEEIFDKFIEEELEKFQVQLKNSNKQSIDISVKSDDIELPVFQKEHNKNRIYEIHIRLTGVLKNKKNDFSFKGYSIVLGRDITSSAVQKHIAQSFTNIPFVMRNSFYKEAFRRKVLQYPNKNIELKNVYVLTGFSDISNSAKLRLDAKKDESLNHNHQKLHDLNKRIESINHSLHDLWEIEKENIDAIYPAVYLLEETDGLDYTLCFPELSDQSLNKKTFELLRKEELNIMIRIIQTTSHLALPLKHLIITHNKKVDFYFEEKFENRFKIATHSVDLFIKKKRLEKAKEQLSHKRITKEGCITIAIDNEEDYEFYHSLVKRLLQNKKISCMEEGNIENISDLPPMRFIRATICNS